MLIVVEGDFDSVQSRKSSTLSSVKPDSLSAGSFGPVTSRGYNVDLNVI